ncbi:beta-ketoacyl-[acyl-carrier-protein] synthase II, partial [Enterococcus faecalis]
HIWGAAGGIEAIACVQTLQVGKALPTVGYQVADPDCDFDYVTEGARDITADYTISNSFGFGGHYGVICLKKSEEN